MRRESGEHEKMVNVDVMVMKKIIMRETVLYLAARGVKGLPGGVIDGVMIIFRILMVMILI